jgi:hypothetical protein
MSNSTIYTATVNNHVKDWFGNPLNLSKKWSFTPATCDWLAREAISSSTNMDSAGKSIDTKTNTHWVGARGQWLQLDLGKVMPICSVYVSWYNSDKTIYDFRISASNDSTNFKKVYDGQSTSNQSWHRYDVNFTFARYIRLDIDDANTDVLIGVGELGAKGIDLGRRSD